MLLFPQVATYLNPKNSEGFIRLDMSEYQNKHEAILSIVLY